ncbi:hypothetical protein HanXRQr2_Chr11g0467461 [Helianthus annuus]|uniref:Uncharacterized protein n=1 Tax=Helianthus annuus TaxID=4232 RepID=A0A9K3HKW6_HELAN|nr:hypothetical protein HanXRQr2_Chr11g0467461 [Helianthus annuus]
MLHIKGNTCSMETLNRALGYVLNTNGSDSVGFECVKVGVQTSRGARKLLEKKLETSRALLSPS